MYRFRFSLFTPNIFQLSSASCDLSICILQSPQFLGLLGHSSFARIIAKLASMWLATRTPTWTSITRRSPACYQSSHTHSLWTTPQSALHTTTGLVYYYLYALHTITGLYTEPRCSQKTVRLNGCRAGGRGAKKGGDKCPVGDRLSPSVVY